MTAIRRLIRWLGPQRSWGLFFLFGATGAASLMLQAVGTETPWVIPTQNGLILLWLAGTALIIAGRLPPEDRTPLIISVGPLLFGLGLGLLFPAATVWFIGAGIGWLIVSRILLRRNVRREYQQAIRHLRRNEYDQAISVLEGLIRVEPKDSAHYRFRAELHRLKGQFSRAVQDYQRIIELEPESGVGYNGLAEVYLQEGDFEQALRFAQQAYAHEPGHWATLYNLGMIEDRLKRAPDVIAHLQAALQTGGLPSRHLLLIYLWLARAYARLGQMTEAGQMLTRLRRQKRGLNEWRAILDSEQSRTLRHVLAGDIDLAQRLFEGAGVEALDSVAVSDEAKQ